jgi:hypothetical protein
MVMASQAVATSGSSMTDPAASSFMVSITVGAVSTGI